MKRFIVECRRIRSFQDFVTAMNEGFIRSVGGDWNGNLDALNDYLSWPSEAAYELELLDSAQCAVALDHGAMAAWLKHKLITCHPSNIPQVQADLAMAERAQGETLFGLICEIIAAKAHVRLILS